MLIFTLGQFSAKALLINVNNRSHTICKVVARSDEPTERFHPTLRFSSTLHGVLTSFGSLFWCSSLTRIGSLPPLSSVLFWPTADGDKAPTTYWTTTFSAPNSRPEPDRFPQESVKSKTVLNIEWLLDLIHQGHLHNSKWLQMLLLIGWMCGFLLTSSQYQLNFSSGQQKSVCILTEWNQDLLLYCMQHRLLYNTLSSSTILPPGGTISVQSFIICHSLEWYIYLQRSPNRGRRACHHFHQGVFSPPAPLSSRHPRSPDFCPTLAGALQACRKFSVKMAKKEEIKEKKKWHKEAREAPEGSTFI